MPTGNTSKKELPLDIKSYQESLPKNSGAVILFTAYLNSIPGDPNEEYLSNICMILMQKATTLRGELKYNKGALQFTFKSWRMLLGVDTDSPSWNDRNKLLSEIQGKLKYVLDTDDLCVDTINVLQKLEAI